MELFGGDMSAAAPWRPVALITNRRLLTMPCTGNMSNRDKTSVNTKSYIVLLCNYGQETVIYQDRK